MVFLPTWDDMTCFCGTAQNLFHTRLSMPERNSEVGSEELIARLEPRTTILVEGHSAEDFIRRIAICSFLDISKGGT